MRVVHSAAAKAQLLAVYRYIADEANPDIAQRYTGSILDQCEKLNRFPDRGTPRDDLRPGLRTIAFKRRVVIAYAVMEDRVLIVGIFYGGQDFAALLTED